MKNKIILWTCILLISLFSVHAASFDVRAIPVDKAITSTEVGKYTIEVTNNFDTETRFRIANMDYPLWDITTEPIINPIELELEPNQTGSVDLNLKPLQLSALGVYDVTILVEAINKQVKLKEPLRISIVSPEAGTFVETVLATIVIDENIDPTDQTKLEVKLDNQNNLEYPNVIVKVNSNLFKDTQELTLSKKEKRTLTFNYDIDPLTKPQDDTLVVEILSGNKTLDTQVKRVRITGHREITREEQPVQELLKFSNTITLNNVGNVPYQEGIRIKTSFLESLFTSSEPKGSFILEDEQRYLVVDVNIEAGSSTTINVHQNYTALVVIVTLLAILWLLYFAVRSPLIIQKTATNVKFKEGGVSEAKIVINVTNRAKTKLKNIEIIDRLANIAQLEKDVSLGTLQPEKVLRNEQKGTIIKWNIDEISTGDERVISYKVRSHLSIVGDFNLPPAIGKFTQKKKEIITHSNKLTISK